MVRYKLVAVKFPEELRDLVNKVSKERGECLSTFVRRAVKKELARMSYLSKSEKKALEIEKKRPEAKP